MAGVARRIEHGDEAAEGVSVHDRPVNGERVAEGADVVCARLEAPRTGVAPLGAAVAAQVQVDHLRRLRKPSEVRLEVRVVEASRPAVQQDDGGPLAHRGAVGHERGAFDVEPEACSVHLDVHATPVVMAARSP